jgi:hypothetical protein
LPLIAPAEAIIRQLVSELKVSSRLSCLLVLHKMVVMVTGLAPLHLIAVRPRLRWGVDPAVAALDAASSSSV